MAGMHTLLLLTALLLGLLTHLGEGAGGCELDDDLSNYQLDRCIQEGDRFVTQLLNSMRDKTRRRKAYNLCQSFQSFKRCFQPIMKNCSEVRHHLLKHWSIIYDVVNCACNGTQSCEDSLNCFMEQTKSKLGRQCEVLYKFNSKQETQDRCHFLYENVRCKEALVESACSPESGVFAFHVAKIASGSHIKRYGCVITRDKPYTGFRYTEKCPANFTTTLEMCEKTHIREKLEFENGFDLIPAESKRRLREECNNYEKYRECTSFLETDCEHGVNKIYAYDGKLRTYLLKMDYICNEGKKGFTQHLRCYRQLLENNTLAQCNHIWHELAPVLDEVNAHNFYCLSNSTVTRKLKQSLSALRGCYEGVFAGACEGGGEVVAQLMEKVFEDPVYLRKRFQPDCRLHAGPPLATGVPPTSPPPRTKPGKYTPPTKELEPNYVIKKDRQVKSLAVSMTKTTTSLLSLLTVIMTLLVTSLTADCR